jgi:predicted enzyme related to lactoylglutathione lyase
LFDLRVVGSAVERVPDKNEVNGSTPLRPTIPIEFLRVICNNIFMSKMNPVVHFEMPARDRKRVSDFYSKVFGWQMNQLGAEMGNYLLAQTTETENMMPKRPGAINGGFFDYQEKEGFNGPHLVISVENLEEAMKSVEESGGKILGGVGGKIDDIPGVGRYVSFEDTEGNYVGMLQPIQKG